MRLNSRPERFWPEIIQIHGSAAPFVLRRSVIFGLIALVITFVEIHEDLPPVAIPLAPYEVVGVALGALLVLRTNAGYERWWEGRKLWGGIVNQSRNLAIECLAHGPSDEVWRRRMICWTVAFSHVARRSLRDQRTLPELISLVGTVETERIARAPHMPGAVALRLARLLREAAESHGMDRFAFLRAEQERADLINHIGACERILKSPLPSAYSIQIRQFICVFFVALPFGILDKLDGFQWMTPLVVFLASYPFLALDEIGVELQNPFSEEKLNHLPIDEICQTIELNLLGLLADQEASDMSRGFSGSRDGWET